MKRALLFVLCVTAASAADKPAGKPPCCREALPAGHYTDRSLYQLDSKWTSDVGREVKLGVLRGRVQVLAMFFAQCEYACPILVNDMQRLEQSLPAAIRGRVEFLLVSFDTERDTPAALRAYREKMQLTPERWTLLRGGADDVRELAALLGVNFQKDARGQFAHSNLITVLNPEGEIIHQQTGLKGDTAATIAALEKTVAEHEKSSAREGQNRVPDKNP